MRGATNLKTASETGSRPAHPSSIGAVKIVPTRDAADGGDMGPTVVPAGAVIAPRLVTDLLIWGGSALLAVSAVVHFHLWDSEGYRNIHIIGPLFILQAIIGFVLAVATAIFRKLALVAGSAILAVSSIGALFISIWWGLFGWQESFTAPLCGCGFMGRGRSGSFARCGVNLARFPVAGENEVRERKPELTTLGLWPLAELLGR